MHLNTQKLNTKKDQIIEKGRLKSIKMEVDKLDDLELYQDAVIYEAWFKEAVEKAKEENRRLGIPSSFGRNGKIFLEMPDGSILQKERS